MRGEVNNPQCFSKRVEDVDGEGGRGDGPAVM